MPLQQAAAELPPFTGATPWVRLDGGGRAKPHRNVDRFGNTITVDGSVFVVSGPEGRGPAAAPGTASRSPLGSSAPLTSWRRASP